MNKKKEFKDFFNKVVIKLSPFIPSDELYIRLKWLATMDYRLNLKDPKSFNEKINWLKLHDRKPEYVTMVDKVAVKDYVASIVGDQYIIPTLAVWSRVEDIDFESLPKQFVLKTNHDSGGVVVCRDRKSFNKGKAIQILNKSLNTDYYLQSREYPYKHLSRRVFAEQYLEDDRFGELRDYKFFCFDGEVKALFVATGRMSSDSETRFDFFDSDFHHLNIINGHPNAIVTPEKPICFEEMKEVAGKLSKGIPHVRVDLYEVNGKVYFGELTFSHWGGFTPFEPESWDYQFGSWIKLPE